MRNRLIQELMARGGLKIGEVLQVTPNDVHGRQNLGGVSIEIVSKVILRHANLSTTQRYLGKISETEATRWIENLYG